jgi:hypothetical protein
MKNKSIWVFVAGAITGLLAALTVQYYRNKKKSGQY